MKQIKLADLHIHTSFSDGDKTPEEIVEIAFENKLLAFAITDHDSISGLESAEKHWKKLAQNNKNASIFVPGVEITCDDFDEGFVDIHVLGLFIDWRNNALTSLLEKAKKQRLEQKKSTIEKLNQLGFKITLEEVQKQAKGGIGRPHIAKVLLQKYSDKFNSIQDIFDKYLAIGNPGFVERTDGIKMADAINAIKKSGGIAVLAHPGVHSNEKIEKLIKFFAINDGTAVETNYPYQFTKRFDTKKTEETNKLISTIAKKNKLLSSGGTDFHGKKTPIEIGATGLDEKNFKRLLKKEE